MGTPVTLHLDDAAALHTLGVPDELIFGKKEGATQWKCTE